MIYSYKVKKRSLTDTEKHCLRGGSEVISNLSPRELKHFYCADFQFTNGDTFVLRLNQVDLTSAIAIE
jgi:hypothetical protein